MAEADFEGTLVLERMAEVGAVEEFLELVDADDLAGAEALMRAVGLDAETVATVLRKMRDGDDEH
jgi:hypothetical protein